MAEGAPELPDDIETLKAMVVAAHAEMAQLRAANAAAETRIERLHGLLKTFERARYGRRSETLDPDQHEFAFEEIQTGLGAVEATLDAIAKPSQPRASRARKKLPAHLERVEIVVEPETTSCRGCGSAERVKIGEDVSERLDVLPVRFRVIVTRRPRYACAACREGVAQAPALPHLIEAGIPTEGLLAQIAVAKYADGLPLYRQEAIYGREQIELPRNLMASWMGRIGFHLEPLADRVLHHIRSGERIFADETTLPTLVPGAGQAKTAWLWTYVRDDRSFGGTGPPMVAYRFEDSRGGKCPAHHLAGFAGLLQSDGYAAYTRLADAQRAGGPVTLAACGHISGGTSTNSMSPASRTPPPGRWSAWPRYGASRRKSAVASPRSASWRGAPHPLRSWPNCSGAGRPSSSASRANPNSPTRSATEYGGAPRSSASSTTAGSTSTTIPSSARSDRKPSRARTRSSLDLTAGAAHGPSSPRCSRPPSSTTSILTLGSS